MLIKTINAIITDSTKARMYIKKFSKDFGKRIDYVNTPSRRIEFATMNDEDAIFVANELQMVTSEAAKAQINKQIIDGQ